MQGQICLKSGGLRAVGGLLVVVLAARAAERCHGWPARRQRFKSYHPLQYVWGVWEHSQRIRIGPL